MSIMLLSFTMPSTKSPISHKIGIVAGTNRCADTVVDSGVPSQPPIRKIIL